jgi:amino acid transporter
MTRTIESLLRFVNHTTAGLLAGSLGFGDAALMPGWQLELPLRKDRRRKTDIAVQAYFNAIGPVALGTAVTLAVGSRGVRPLKRALDTATAIGLAGVLAATIMGTVPINKVLEEQPASDYPSDRSKTLTRNWSRAHAFRTTLGIGAFVCAVASNLTNRHAK